MGQTLNLKLEQIVIARIYSFND